jgi:peptidoglycan/LPS O-acetylase OafA/YrhL
VTAGPRYPCVGGLRAIAATAVVVTHAAFWTGSYTADTTGRALARLDVGVALFFALSGFLLSQPFFRAAAQQRPAPRTSAYLWRRALRILPAYWAVVVLALLLLPGNEQAGLADWMRHLGLAQIYVRYGYAQGLTHTWSLCTEVAFYLVLPFLAAGLLRSTGRDGWRPTRLLLTLAGIAGLGWMWLAWAWADPQVIAPLDVWLPSFAGWFGAGMAMAVLSVSSSGWAPVRRAHELGSSLWTCWAGAAALFWIACGPLAGPLSLEPPTPVQALTKSVLYAGVACLALWPLVFGDQRAGATRRVLASRPVAYLGEISYGLFLFHMPVLITIYTVLDRSPFTGSFVAVLVATWAGGAVAATASYRLMERPLMSQWRDLVRDRPGAPEVPPNTAAPADDQGAGTSTNTGLPSSGSARS